MWGEGWEGGWQNVRKFEKGEGGWKSSKKGDIIFEQPLMHRSTLLKALVAEIECLCISLSAEFTFIRISKNFTSANSENYTFSKTQISQIPKIACFRKKNVLQY